MQKNLKIPRIVNPAGLHSLEAFILITTQSAFSNCEACPVSHTPALWQRLHHPIAKGIPVKAEAQHPWIPFRSWRSHGKVEWAPG